MRSLRRLFPKLQIAGTSEGDRVTNLELFFDLVYAFAFTQVTSIMGHGHAPGSILDGLIVLSLLWFSWCAYSWLANQARADRGVLRIAVAVAMLAVFIGCLALPDAFHRTPHAVNAALVVAGCYTVVRLTHAGSYLIAAENDRRLQRQVLITVSSSLTPVLVLLFTGAAIGGETQRWLWLVAVAYDFASVFVTARITRGWVIRSAAHFSERYGLIVLLALGESIIAITTPLSSSHLTGRSIGAATLAVLVALGLYLVYFESTAASLERALERLEGTVRADVGRDVFTYLHYPMIAGVILTALGLEQAMDHLGGEFGALGGWSLGIGTGLFLLATAGAVARATGVLMTSRLVIGLLLVACAPALAVMSPVLALAAVVAVLAVTQAVAPPLQR